MRELRLSERHGESARDEINVADVMRVLYRRRILIGTIVVLAIAAAAIYTGFQVPEYQSEASVQIHSEQFGRSGIPGIGGTVAGIAGLGQNVGGIATDMLVMQSRRIVEHVSDSLSLHVELTYPRAPRTTFFSAVHAPRDVRPVLVEFQRSPDGTYLVRVEPRSGAPVPHPDRAVPGVPLAIGRVSLTVVDQPDGVMPERITVDILPFREAVERVRRNLEVVQAGRGAQIVTVRYRSRDPVMAAAVPNAVTRGFIRHKNETSKTESRSRARFLREQVANYEIQLAAAEARLQAFSEQEQIISVQDQATEQVRRFAQLQVRRDELKEERDALQRLLARVQQESSSVEAQDTYRQLASFPVFFANPTIQNIIRSLIDLENNRAELMVRRTEASVDVQGIDSRIRELEFQLMETAENYLESRENQMASLDATLGQFGQQVGAVPAREIEFARLSGQRELLAGIYRQLQTRLHEVEVEEAVEPLDVQLLDPALMPERQASPRLILNLILGGVLGVALALLVVFVGETLDTRVRSRSDVVLASGGLPVMATIPRIQSSESGRINGRRSLRRIGRARPDEQSVSSLVSRDAPRSLAAEAYRALRTRVFFRRDGSVPATLVIMSAVAGEGKSTSAANLAVALAQQGVRTLLIDADLRRGVLHRLFDVEQAPGLSEVLQEKVAVEEAIHVVHVGGAQLDVLATGVFPPNPSELVGSVRMQRQLRELQDRYDRIVIDTPPLSSATDSAVLGSMPSTAALLVARAGFSDRTAIEHVARELQDLGIRVDGVIVNDVPLPDAPAYRYQPAGGS